MNSSAAATIYDPTQGIIKRNVTTPAAGPGLVEVQIMATGVCHSDLHIVNGDWPVEVPLVLGHEAAGKVTAVGNGVDSVREGDHVVLSWFAACGECRRCRQGKTWLCTGTKALENSLPDGSTPFQDENGQQVWPYLGLGTFTSTVLVPESAVVRVPHELPYEIGALLGCSVTTGVGAVANTAGVSAGESAIVIGCGGVGLSIIMGLKLAGANPIIAVDFSDERLEVAMEYGATQTLNGRTADAVQWCQEQLGGVDYAFEAIGNAKVIETLPAMLGSGGAAVLVGMTPQGAKANIDPFDLADQGKSLLGCNYGSSVAHEDIPRLAQLYIDGQLPLDSLIGSIRPLAEAKSALADLASGSGLRTVLVPEGSSVQLTH